VKKTLNQDDGKTEHFFWAHYDGQEVGAHSSLTLFGWPSSTYRARPGAGQSHHIAFRAASEEEQAAWRDHLLSMGVQVSPVKDRKYFRSIYFNAPDGLLLEIATDGPGFAVDEEAGSLGQSLQLPAWLEGEREDIMGRLRPLESADAPSPEATTQPAGANPDV
jgi:glyoxalase family protein